MDYKILPKGYIVFQVEFITLEQNKMKLPI